MRRPVVLLLSFAALATPVAAVAAHGGSTDGTLVVKSGQAPRGVPVVTLAITGSVIGQVSDYGKIVFNNPPGAPSPEVTGASYHAISNDGTETWAGPGFKFRAVGGHFALTIYGSGVDIVAIGKGSVVLAGMPGTAVGDGRYSLNGRDFVSLPGTPTKELAITGPAPTAGG
jgi:hypothetical protein